MKNPKQEVSKFYVAKAEPANSGAGFVARWALPGFVPGVVTDETGKPAIFPTPELAEYAALQTMRDVGNQLPTYANKRQGNPEKYKKLSGPDFAVAVADANVTVTTLSFITGQKMPKISLWFTGFNEKGEPDRPPHWMRVLLAVFAKVPGSYEVALKVTEENTYKD